MVHFYSYVSLPAGRTWGKRSLIIRLYNEQSMQPRIWPRKNVVWYCLCIFGIHHPILWAVRLSNSDHPFHKFSARVRRRLPIHHPWRSEKEAICVACLASDKKLRIVHQERHGGQAWKSRFGCVGEFWENHIHDISSTGFQTVTASYSPARLPFAGGFSP